MIDLTDDQDHEILRTTEADGLLGGSYLSGQPLGQYLEGDEQPKYVLRNKKSGVSIEGDRQRSLEPASDFQSFALVTDIRIIFVVGQQGGDDSVTVALPDIVEVNSDSGLRTSTLSLETLEDELWEFACSDDPATVETYLEEAAQIWANAARLLDDFEASLDRAEEDLAEGNCDRARERVDDARETVDTAINRSSEVGPGARERITDRAERLQTRLTGIDRKLLGREGARAHAMAHSHWEQNEYEAAAASYEQAIDRYQNALDTNGSTPPTQSLQQRLRGAAGERELLRVGPIADADSARRCATALSDPEEAAGEWERALNLYRDLLTLDEDDFVVSPDVIREQTTDLADDAISDHCEAARQWLTAGDKLAVQDRIPQAVQVYERAAEQFEHARQLAREVRPERLDSVEQAIAATEMRLDGDCPTATVPDDPVAFDPAADDPDEEDTDSPEAEPVDDDGMGGLSFHDSGQPSTQPPKPSLENGGDRPAESESGSDAEIGGDNPAEFDETDSNSLLDQIQAQKTASKGASSEPVSADTESEGADEFSAVSLRERLEALDAGQLRELAARLWEAEGWMTSILDETAQPDYDVVALGGDTDDRLLLWTVDADSGPVDETVVQECERTLDDSDTAIVVTTATIRPSAESAAANADVKLIGPEGLLDRINDADLDSTISAGQSGESPQT
jgi:tetratricopeptide (TPR) repeat protein